MKHIRTLLGVAGVLLLALGTNSCVNSSTCQCAQSSAASKFAYVMLEFDTIAAYSINPNTGGLLPVTGSPFGGNISPFYAAADPAGKFLYAVDPNAGLLYGFSIDQTTGALTAVPGSPYTPSASEARVPLVAPSGNFLYVSHLDSCGDDCQGAISAYKINADGSLAELPGSPFPTDYGTLGIAIQPSGNFLYAMNGTNCCRTANSISAFQVNPTSGVLSQITGSPFPISATPSLAAIQSDGNFMYVIVAGEGSAVAPFSINASSGVPTSTGSFFQVGQNPQGIDLDVVDSFLFVANNGLPGTTDGSISVFRFNSTTGALTPATGSPVMTAGSNPLQLAVDRSCRFLYVTNNNPGKGTAGDYVLGYSIDALAGTLMAVSGSPFATPSGGPPQGIVLTPHQAPTVP